MTVRLVLFLYRKTASQDHPVGELTDIVDAEARRAWKIVTHQARRRRDDETIAAKVLVEHQIAAGAWHWRGNFMLWGADPDLERIQQEGEPH